LTATVSPQEFNSFMQLFLEQLLNGIAMGSIYALITP